MRVATFNAASIRARLPILLDWLETVQPDVLAVQETKVEDDKFPFEPFEEIGYHCEVNGQKSYNGVALISLEAPTEVIKGYQDPLFPEDARIIAGRFGSVQIINTYVPNGTRVGSDKFDYKLRWLERFRQFLMQKFSANGDALWMGDINIALKPEDVYDSKKVLGGVGHHPAEFERLQEILNWGLTDVFRFLHPDSGEFTYWEFVIRNALEKNVGWRIDHIYATPSLVPKVKECWIDKEPRTRERPSDHTFVVADIEL